MTLLSRTKEIAKKRGMSMESLANKVGISKSGIYQWHSKSLGIIATSSSG